MPNQKDARRPSYGLLSSQVQQGSSTSEALMGPPLKTSDVQIVQIGTAAPLPPNQAAYVATDGPPLEKRQKTVAAEQSSQQGLQGQQMPDTIVAVPGPPTVYTFTKQLQDSASNQAFQYEDYLGDVVVSERVQVFASGRSRQLQKEINLELNRPWAQIPIKTEYNIRTADGTVVKLSKQSNDSDPKINDIIF